MFGIEETVSHRIRPTRPFNRMQVILQLENKYFFFLISQHKLCWQSKVDYTNFNLAAEVFNTFRVNKKQTLTP